MKTQKLAQPSLGPRRAEAEAEATLLKPIHLHGSLTACVARTTEGEHTPVLNTRGVQAYASLTGEKAMGEY